MSRHSFGKFVRGLIGVTLGLLLCADISAQQPQPSPVDKPAPPAAEASKDDILILVNLTAKELKFETVPKSNVEFPGNHERSTVWVTDRYNLPDKLEPGVTYRNFGITLRISSRFADIERIVREALGEVPVNDVSTQPMAVTSTLPERAEPVTPGAISKSKPTAVKYTRKKIR